MVEAQRLTPEVRVDGIFASHGTVQAGVGAGIPLSTYVRGVMVLGAGADREGAGTYRADAMLRFHLDPFREHRWGPYAAGGLSLLRNGDDPRAWVLLVLGLEGPLRGGAATAFEIGLGGGARIGIVLRRARARQR